MKNKSHIRLEKYLHEEIAESLANKVAEAKTKKEKLEILESWMMNYVRATNGDALQTFCMGVLSALFDTNQMMKAYQNTIGKHLKQKRLEPSSNYDVYLKNKRIAERFGRLGMLLEINLENL